MGHTLKQLASGKISNRCIFNNRFVVEIAEKVHLHYRNLRINLNLPDFLELSQGCISAIDRWQKRDKPEPKVGVHIELCRRKVGIQPVNDNIQVNLNTNLYKLNEGKIFAEGAEFEDKNYIHLKIRDLRLELSFKDFKEVADVITKAQGQIENLDPSTLLQKT